MPKEITLNHITKIEGHAKLNLSMEGGKVTKCELSATEGSRYFEGIVRGRKYYEAHEMTSRICGICSCAHVIAALSAVEDALGVQISEQTYKLRELLTLGERIRSHATHLYFLALPDYLGYESALAMAPKYGKELKSALAMMKAGNGIIRLLGSRDLHPVSATVGGWLKLPKQEQIDENRGARHDGARAAAEAVLEKLRHGVDAGAQKIGQKAERHDHEGDGRHPFVARDRHSDMARGVAAHAHELLGRDVGGDQGKTDQPPAKAPPREKVILAAAPALALDQADRDDGHDKEQEDHEIDWEESE